MNVGHRLADGVRSVVAYWTPTPTQSQFEAKGTLTPEEFTAAGDQLCFKFPTWHWRGAATKGREVAWLRPEKQYLLTCNVPCKGKVRDLDKTLANTAREEAEGGWMMPGEDHVEEEISEIQDMSAKEEKARDDVIAVQHNYVSSQDEMEEEIPDISSFHEVDNLLTEDNDPAADVPESSYFVRNAPDAEVVKTRTFDISITYDKYYQTPRIWLFGYDENGIPLKTEQVFEYILTEYASKTVTVDPHPSTGVPTVSIHPCKHAAVMRKVVSSWVEQGLEPRHDLALFVLLKFISSVIPTIEYDFTMDVDMILQSQQAPGTTSISHQHQQDGSSSSSRSTRLYS
eukprot:GHVS01094211.1.p1 GENE.GHVS01094211.1~~GHVS01094211.1.p1  ORF type:complete len:342 (+),score=56.65 GHVS01094211.1:103-1128(+)